MGWPVFAPVRNRPGAWQGKQASLSHYMGTGVHARCIWQVQADEMARQGSSMTSFVYTTPATPIVHLATYLGLLCVVWATSSLVPQNGTDRVITNIYLR